VFFGLSASVAPEEKMEVEMLEDDVFFAELSKRISLLITDDDDADFTATAVAPLPVSPFSSPSVPSGGPFGHVWSPHSSGQLSFCWEGLVPGASRSR
jgi:hypothetical protein